MRGVLRAFQASAVVLALVACSSEPSATSTSSTGATSGGGAGPDCPGGEHWDGSACVADHDPCYLGGACAPGFDCVSVGGAPKCIYDAEGDYAWLTSGVQTIESGGALPSAMVVYGETAFPVVMDENNLAFVAAARVGDGTVVAYAHEALMGGAFSGGGDQATLLRNAVTWRRGETGIVVGIGDGLPELEGFMTGSGFTAKPASLDDLASVDVYCMDTYTEYSADQYAKIRDFVSKGGGLITGGHAWWWAQTHENVAVDYPGNRILIDAGINVTPATVDAQTDVVEPFVASGLLYASHSLDLLLRHLQKTALLDLPEVLIGVETTSFAVEWLPLSIDPFYDRVRLLLDEVDPVVPTEASPIEPAKQPIQALVVRIEHKFASELPASDVKAHAGAADFPGAVPADAPAVVETIDIDASYVGREGQYAFSGAGAPVWRSTGLYAPAGALVTVTVPVAAAGKGLSVLIGAHTDELWGIDSWPRFPAITRSYPLDAPMTKVASAFGGTVYVRVPSGAMLGSVPVGIDGAIRAPWYVHGKTTLSDWVSTVRDYPAPWAELQTDSLALTVPSSVIRTLDDPSALMTFWDSVLDAQADLAAIDHSRVRPERIVADREISAGYMHSGYPIMGHLDIGPTFVDAAGLQSKGDWGAFHELGHNHQWIDWVLPGSVEASVNLWSVYTYETVLGIDRSEAHSALAPADRAQRIADYLAAGSNFSNWSVWTSLETYLQLQEGFGWAPFQAVFAEYRAIPAGQEPMTDPARIDRWVVTFSKSVGKNLGPFFLAWGFPVSQAALGEIAGLAAWDEDPMAM